MLRDRRSVRTRPRRNCRTGKVRYRDHVEAVLALQFFAVWSDRDVVPVRCYECPFCAGFHLTSQAQRS